QRHVVLRETHLRKAYRQTGLPVAPAPSAYPVDKVVDLVAAARPAFPPARACSLRPLAPLHAQGWKAAWVKARSPPVAAKKSRERCAAHEECPYRVHP